MANTMFPLQVSPTVPEPLRRLSDLAQNFWFSWYPETGQVFRKLDTVLWRKVDGNPKLFLRCVDQGILERAAGDPEFLAGYGAVLADFDRYLQKTDAAKLDELDLDGPRGVFLRRVRLARELPDLFRAAWACSRATTARPRATCACRSSPWDCSIARATSTRRIDRNGQQIPEYPPIDPRSHAAHDRDDEGAGRRFERLRVSCPFPGREVALRVWKAAVGRVAVLLARYRRRRECARGPQGHARAVRRRPRPADAAGSRARRRRRARVARARPEPHGVAHQRGSRCVLRDRAPARVHDAGRAVRRGARSHGREHGVHDAHARERGPRRVPARARRAAVRELSRRARDLDRGAARSRPLRRAARRVQHDAARAARRGRRERREQDPRPGVVEALRGELARRAPGREPRRLRDERRARADVLTRRVDGAARQASLGRLARSNHGPYGHDQDPRNPGRPVLEYQPEGQEPDAAGRARAARAPAQAQRLERGAHPSALAARGSRGSRTCSRSASREGSRPTSARLC